MIKVIHVIWSPTIGGIERVVLDLITEQIKNPELQVSLLIGRGEGALLSSFNALTIPVICAGLKNGADISPAAYKKAKDAFLNNDIVHIHSFNPLLALAAVKSRRKIIYTEHGNFGIGKKQNRSAALVTMLRKRFLNNHIHYICFNSDFTREMAVQRYGLRKVKQQVIYNGIPLNSSELPAPPDLKQEVEKHFTIGTVARMAGVKRIDRLLRAYALFSKDKDCRLLIIGDGPLLPEMKALAISLGITGTTIFAGYRQDARACIQLMDVCAFTSEKEAFGLVAVEAWNEGKPVVVFSDAGGLAEIVRAHNPDDIAGDVISYAALLNKYYNDRKNDNSTEQEARKQYARNFSIEKMEGELLNIYLS